MTPKEQCEVLLDKLLPFAEEQMKKYREFYPFAAVLLSDDSVELTASYDGNEHPESQKVLNDLTQIHKQLADEGKIKASGIAWNASVSSANGKPVDAVIVSLEHKDGYSVIVGQPYKIGWLKKVKFGDLFAMPGRHDIFPGIDHEPQWMPMNMEDYKKQLQNSVIAPMTEYMQDCADCGFTKKDVEELEFLVMRYLDSLEGLKEPSDQKILEQVKVLVLALNDLNEKTEYSMIETVEREAICELIQSSAVAYGLRNSDDDVTEEWREW
ncbi:MAG: hypothetical protein IJW70_03845 [Clostridia bacterium]|nr:hypothetical protein [Clostridia bacterium]